MTATKTRGKSAMNPAPSVPIQSQLARCPWVDLSKPDYVAYHDDEWGVPVTDDRLMFEYLILEGAQAGLSWYTVLRKRDAYRRAFAQFDIRKVAAFSVAKIDQLMTNEGLIRHRPKLAAAVTNARASLEVQAEFGSLCRYIWSFVDHRPIVNRPRDRADYRVTSPESDRLSADLKRRGFKFVGSTIIYAYMQATGLYDDHAQDCFRAHQIVTCKKIAE